MSDGYADLQIHDTDGTTAAAVTVTPIADGGAVATRVREALEAEFGDDRVVDLHE